MHFSHFTVHHRKLYCMPTLAEMQSNENFSFLPVVVSSQRCDRSLCSWHNMALQRNEKKTGNTRAVMLHWQHS